MLLLAQSIEPGRNDPNYYQRNLYHTKTHKQRKNLDLVLAPTQILISSLYPRYSQDNHPVL